MDDDPFSLDKFELYNLARRYRKGLYQLVRQLPAEERFALGMQLRRAAVSITNNIAEGHGRWHYTENRRFCRIARGSVEETIDDLNVCLDESYGVHEQLEQLKMEANVLMRRINSYIAYLNRTRPGTDEK